MGPSVKERVENILIEHLGLDADEVTPTAKLAEDLGADSLDVVELVMGIEEEFGIEIDDTDYDAGQFATVADVVSYVEKKLKPKTKAA